MSAPKKTPPEKSSSAPRKPLAVIGMSCMFPRSESLQSYWSTVKNKVDAIEAVPESHWKISDYYHEDAKTPDMTIGRTGGFLPKLGFDPTEWGMLPDAIEATDTTQLYALVVANAALIDAGYGKDREFDRERVSVLLGITGTLELALPLAARLGHPKWRRALRAAGVPDDVAEDVVANIGESYVSWQENSFPGLLGNVASGRIANRLDLHGSNCVTDAACASSLSAAHLACMELETGHADMAITGGCDTFNDIFMYMCFTKTPALSATGHARPLSTKADGTILGEGVGMVVLKRLEDAERDGDKIYATIRGIGSSSDGKGKSIYAPSSSGQARCLRDAYLRAGITPEDIDLVECHGTGTKVGDATEFDGLHEVFGKAGENGPWCAIGSVKSQIGHCKAAAGTAGLVKSILAIHHKVLPPTIKVEQPAEQFARPDSPFYVNVEKRPWLPREDGKPRLAGVSSFGFGGSNYHAIIEEYGREKTTVDWDGDVEILALSGGSTSELKSALAETAKASDWRALRLAAARSRSAFDGKAPHRLLAVLQEGKTWAEQLQKLSAMLDARKGETSWSTPDGSAYASGTAAPGKLAFVFPGQGAQYVGMGLDGACLFPEMLETLAQANAAWGRDEKTRRRLSDHIYPHSVWSKETEKANEAALTATDVAQPAIGAISFGLERVLARFGLRPDATAGHSYGELVALASAGRITPEELHRLSKLRGELMARGEGDRGSMLAARCTEDEARKLIEEEKLDLVIANKNMPQQMVLSGPTAEIDKAVEACKTRGIRGTKLQVAAAFHSKLVSEAAEPFGKALGEVSFAPGQAKVYANTTGAAYPEKAKDCREILGRQLACSVEWVKLVESMYADGVRSFVEVGPGKRLCGMLDAILEGKEHLAVALDASSGRKGGVADLARALCAIAAAGHEVNLAPWADGEAFIEAESKRRKPRLTVEICGANYRSPKKTKRPLPPRPKDLPALAPRPVQAPGQAARPAPLPSPSPAAAPAPHPSAPAPVPSPAPAPLPAPLPAPAPVASPMVHESLIAIAQMQERTAQLHKAFLEGQEQAQRTLQALVSGAPTVGARPVQAVAMPAARPVEAASLPSPVATPVAPRTPAPAPVAPRTPAPAPVAPRTPAPTPVAAPAAGPASRPMPPSPRAAVPAPASPRIREALLEIVAEKTGYPVEMLDPSMDMEADLGIDSIKRVEIMSAVQEKIPEAPVVQPDQVGQLKTLADILETLDDGEAARPQPLPSSPSPAPAPSSPRVREVLLEIVAEKTGYPVEMLDPSMDMEADLGIDSIKRVEIMSAVQEKIPEAPVVQPDQVGQLKTLADILETLDAAQAPGQAASSGQAVSPGQAARPAPLPSASSPRVREVLLEIVAEKTGYPAEMLDPSMDMEADLGIDSIKRVEIMSAVQERLPEAPVVQPDQVGQLKTLADILDTLGRASQPVPPAARAAVPSSSAPSSPSSPRVREVLLEIVAEKTGYPAEMLDPSMDMEADLGIDSIKRVEIMSAVQERLPEAPVVQPDQVGQLKTLADILDTLDDGEAARPQPLPSSPSPSPSSPSAPQVDASRVRQVLLSVVGEKTGYPAEMLDDGMDMEADLGIDSIKRVEIMSAIQEQLPDAPVVQPDEVGQLKTLADIVGLLAVSAGQPAQASRPAPGQAAMPAPLPSSPSPSSPAPSDGAMQSALLEIVSEKTGYPAEMLEPDMDMEADLGIDSIKRVEILSAFQERMPDAPVVQPDAIGDFRTLKQVIAHLTANSGRSLQPGSTPVVTATPVIEDEGASVRLSRKALRAEPFALDGKPVLLKLPDGAPIWISSDGTELAPAVKAEFERRGFVPEIVSLQSVAELTPPRGLAGLVLLAPPSPVKDGEMTRPDSRELLDRAFALTQKAAPRLKETAESAEALFATVSRFDGAFGLKAWVESFDPAMGALAGLSKTVGHEWDACTARAFDLARGWDEKKAAAALVNAMLQAGPVELGLGPDGAVQLHERESVPRPRPEAPLAAGDLVLVSGGARGVTADCAVALARRFAPTLVLLGRSPAPAAEPEWLRGLDEPAAMKKAILAHAETPMKPRDLETAYRAWCGGRQIQETLDRIAAAGARAVYVSVDVRDAKALAAELDALRAQHGPVRAIVHGAGVLRDKRIEDKLPEHFDAVYGTKVDGIEALLEAVGEDELRCMAFFSSSTGRYGRTGQVDYAMANECLNKVARQQARRRPGCRVVSIGWGPWAGGMVTPELEKIFAAEGVGLIPLAAGARLLADELAAVPEASIEIVVGAFPEGEKPGEAEEDPFVRDGTAGPAVETGPNVPSEEESAPTLAFERTIDAAEHAFLESHVINGDHVLPVAMIMEWLAQGALHENPGYAFHGFDGLRVTRGVTFGLGASVPVAVWATKARGKSPLVSVELRSADGAIVHARGKVRLLGKLPRPEAPALSPTLGRSYPVPVERIYDEILFHGKHFRGIEAVEGCTTEGITARVHAAPAPARWMVHPLRSDWLADPLVMDTAFQLMILWTHDQAGELSLPSYLGTYRQFVRSFPEKVRTVIRVEHGGLMTVKADMEFVDESGALLARLDGYECVMSPGLRKGFARRKAEGR